MKRLFGIGFVLVFALGCKKEEEMEKPSAPAGGGASGLSKLSPADRALAEAQKTCPVSGKPLGGMGTPVKIQHGDVAVFLCCGSCKEPFEKEPEKYLAKLKGK